MEKYLKEARKIIKAEVKRNKISKLKKSKAKEFIRNIFKTKNEKGKNAKISLYDELHSYKENKEYNNLIAVTPEEHHRINNKIKYPYRAEYMQNPFEILTEENLERLEKHCKKAIYNERGEIKREHEVTLELLYKYKEQNEEITKQNKVINLMSEKIYEEGIVWDNKEEVIGYFRKKVEV